ncbi:hypothetical protein AXG93_3218s1220 [Marchantia polymorpha subsp. ruderalis]|uniref:Uncharacterized protein n=1 Tax=Marchantia polymorpha subsp. ruderalis TaxID=1480154 RepID=A0A176WH90_MARPO|nr:hypothetical protein AXG93_3218s1220 [Marchantia polymorpha subsp. ruderalis]
MHDLQALYRFSGNVNGREPTAREGTKGGPANRPPPPNERFDTRPRAASPDRIFLPDAASRPSPASFPPRTELALNDEATMKGLGRHNDGNGILEVLELVRVLELPFGGAH